MPRLYKYGNYGNDGKIYEISTTSPQTYKLCPKCFPEGHISVLVLQHYIRSGPSVSEYHCKRCDSIFTSDYMSTFNDYRAEELEDYMKDSVFVGETEQWVWDDFQCRWAKQDPGKTLLEQIPSPEEDEDIRKMLEVLYG